MFEWLKKRIEQEQYELQVKALVEKMNSERNRMFRRQCNDDGQIIHLYSTSYMEPDDAKKIFKLVKENINAITSYDTETLMPLVQKIKDEYCGKDGSAVLEWIGENEYCMILEIVDV